MRNDDLLIPRIPLIQFHTILFAQSTKFILEGFLSVMLILILDVAYQRIDVVAVHCAQREGSHEIGSDERKASEH